jgi:hypothetical protein
MGSQVDPFSCPSLGLIAALTQRLQSGHPESNRFSWIPGRASYRQLARNDV